MTKVKLLVNVPVRSSAELIFNNLHGLICVYKPADIHILEVMGKLKMAFVKGINALPCRPVEQIVKVNDETGLVYIDQNNSDTIQALGYRYIRSDFKMTPMHPLDIIDSGVQIFSLNDKTDLRGKIESMRLMRVYELKGRLGVWTQDFTPRGKLVEKATYGHVNRAKIDRVMASIQATYQREMFKHMGVDLKSQEAYDLASKGLLRPKNTSTPPQIYSIRCLEFDRPFFKIEIHTINESTRFLRNLIHDIGLRLRSYAICMQIRRVKDGFATFDSDCLAFNELEFDKLCENNEKITTLARQHIFKYDKTVVVGQTRQEQHKNDQIKTDQILK